LLRWCERGCSDNGTLAGLLFLDGAETGPVKTGTAKTATMESGTVESGTAETATAETGA
jgi:hypothetical protein